MLIVFLIDTSASMSQRTYLGTSLFEVARTAVEQFLKLRQRDALLSRWDRYMLFTLDAAPCNVRAGWRESLQTFLEELKTMRQTGLSNFGVALKGVFDFLNLNRAQTGIDNYGMGRYPYFIEPAAIICLTDGGKLTDDVGIQQIFSMPTDKIVPGSELTREPFRWDQRVFAIVLRLPGFESDAQQSALANGNGQQPATAASGALNQPSAGSSNGVTVAEDCPLNSMCEVSGGRTFLVQTARDLQASLEHLVAKCSPTVTMRFEKCGPDPLPLAPTAITIPTDSEEDESGSVQQKTATNTTFQSCLANVQVPRNPQKGVCQPGLWPVPESFWPDVQQNILPSRSAHPLVRFVYQPNEPILVEPFYDKYELESCPLSSFILERKQTHASAVWVCYVAHEQTADGKDKTRDRADLPMPFGFLKASSNMQSVSLFVLPYNYPMLLPLIDEFVKAHKGKPSVPFVWRGRFEAYMRTIPPYYFMSLRKALQRISVGLETIVPDIYDGFLHPEVPNMLKRIRNIAREQYPHQLKTVGAKPLRELRFTPRSKPSNLLNAVETSWNARLPTAKGAAPPQPALSDMPTDFRVLLSSTTIRSRPYNNPYDIRRDKLVTQIAKLRVALHRITTTGAMLQDVDETLQHELPIQQMGNYQEYAKRLPAPLRELEQTATRLHTFGNPFKVRMMIDEADDLLGLVATNAQTRMNAPADTPARENGTGSSNALRKHPGKRPAFGSRNEAQSAKRRKQGPLPRELTWERIRGDIAEKQRRLSLSSSASDVSSTSASSENRDTTSQASDVSDTSSTIGDLYSDAETNDDDISSIASGSDAIDDTDSIDQQTELGDSDLLRSSSTHTSNGGTVVDVPQSFTERVSSLKRQIIRTIRNCAGERVLKRVYEELEQLRSHLCSLRGAADAIDLRFLFEQFKFESLRFKRERLYTMLCQYEKVAIQLIELETRTATG